MKISKFLAFIVALLILVSTVACNKQSLPINDDSLGNSVSNTENNNGNDNEDSDKVDDEADNEANDDTDNKDDNENDNKDDGVTDGETDTKPESTITPDKVVDLTTFLDNMASSVYKLTDTVTESNIGLTNSKSVGVDKTRFENEILYPVPADSEFDHIYKASDYGISTDNKDNSLALSNLIKTIKGVDGLKKIEFDPGVYKFKTTLIFENINDLYICSSDPTQNFEILMTSWTQGISVSKCDNIHFNNYDFDYETSPTVAGEVVSFDPKTLTVKLKIFDEFDLSKSQYNGGKLGHNWASYIEFKLDESTGEYIPDNEGNIRTGSELVSGSYNASTKEMTIVFSKSARYPNRTPKIGARASLAFTMYNHHGFKGSDCGKIYMENINVYTTCGMAFGLEASEGFYLNRVNLNLREGSTRLMTATADGFHTSDIRDIKITNSVFQYSHDDAFNIKNTFNYVTGVSAKRITIQAAKNYVVEVGDEIEFFEEETMRSRGKYTVKKVDTSGTQLVIQVDKILDEDIVGCLVGNNTKATRLTFDNNVIGNKRNRGILAQTRESTITNNTWHNMIHGAVVIFTERASFKEGICPNNVIVSNNKFIGNYGGDITVFSYGSLGPRHGGITKGLLEDIYVINNFFASTPVTSLSISACGNSSFSDNLFYNTSLSTSAVSGITIDNSEDLDVSNNCFYSNAKSTLTTIGIGANCDNIEQNNNIFKKIN